MLDESKKAELVQGLQDRKEEMLKALEETRLANAALCRKFNRKLLDCQRKDADLIAKLQEQIKRVEILTPDGTKRTMRCMVILLTRQETYFRAFQSSSKLQGLPVLLEVKQNSSLHMKMPSKVKYLVPHTHLIAT